jgi:hypothetical protein
MPSWHSRTLIEVQERRNNFSIKPQKFINKFSSFVGGLAADFHLLRFQAAITITGKPCSATNGSNVADMEYRQSGSFMGCLMSPYQLQRLFNV